MRSLWTSSLLINPNWTISFSSEPQTAPWWFIPRGVTVVCRNYETLLKIITQRLDIWTCCYRRTDRTEPGGNPSMCRQEVFGSLWFSQRPTKRFALCEVNYQQRLQPPINWIKGKVHKTSEIHFIYCFLKNCKSCWKVLSLKWIQC